MNSKIFIKTRYILSSNIRSIKLHCKCRVICIRSNFNSPFISIESMASKGTPKKFYKKRPESTGSISHCRLCNCIADPGHSKNLFRNGKQTTLRNAELRFMAVSCHKATVFLTWYTRHVNAKQCHSVEEGYYRNPTRTATRCKRKTVCRAFAVCPKTIC